MAESSIARVRALIDRLGAVKRKAGDLQNQIEEALVAAEKHLLDDLDDRRDELYQGVEALHVAAERGETDRQLLGRVLRLAALLDELDLAGRPA